MDPFGLVAALVGFVERLFTRRQRIVLRADVAERALMSVYPYDDAHTVVNRIALIRIYNGGPSRVTVNAAGWEAKDGTRTEAYVPSDSTLEPGAAELEATGDPAALVRAHDGHSN